MVRARRQAHRVDVGPGRYRLLKPGSDRLGLDDEWCRWSVVTASYGLLLVVGLLFCAYGAVSLARLRWRPRDVPLSRRWWSATMGVGALYFGFVFAAIAVWPSSTVVGVASFWGLLTPAGPALVALVYWMAEVRENRRIRLQLGMSPLRRRLPWGWVVVAWFVVSTFVAVFAMAGIAVLWPGSIAPGSDLPVLVMMVTAGAGSVVVGFVQAWRGRVRDRQIEADNLARAGLVRLDAEADPPAWMPTRYGRLWMQWARSLDEPVEPGDEIAVIGSAVLAGLVLLAVSVFVGYSMLTELPASLPAQPVLVVTVGVMVVGMIVAAVFALASPLAKGLRTAVRQLRAGRDRIDDDQAGTEP